MTTSTKVAGAWVDPLDVRWVDSPGFPDGYDGTPVIASVLYVGRHPVGGVEVWAGVDGDGVRTDFCQGLIFGRWLPYDDTMIDGDDFDLVDYEKRRVEAAYLREVYGGSDD